MRENVEFVEIWAKHKAANMWHIHVYAAHMQHVHVYAANKDAYIWHTICIHVTYLHTHNRPKGLCNKPTVYSGIFLKYALHLDNLDTKNAQKYAEFVEICAKRTQTYAKICTREFGNATIRRKICDMQIFAKYATYAAIT